jgi:DNA-binding HxlR family transcriptional regulator
MSAPVRYDDQYCPIARALDLLGDRWTLLVLRELMAGEQRFTDLKAHLPGITPAVLSNRLRTLSEQGLIAGTGGTRPRYSLTEQGRATAPVMRAMARFGMPLLEEPAAAASVRPWSAVQTCLIPYWDAQAADGVDDDYLFRLDGEDLTVAARRGGAIVNGRKPALVVETTAATLFEIRKGLVAFDTAMAEGRLLVHGSKAAQRRMRRVFQLD